MASKIDKEALKKNLFWILLGVFVVFWIAGVGIAVVPGDGKAAKDYDKTKKAVDATKSKGIKTPAYQAPWNQHGKTFSDYKDVIWKKAWLQQEGMYDWPASMVTVAGRPLYPELPFARDADGKKNVTADQAIRNRFPDWYKEQFEGLAGIVEPAKFNGDFATVFPEQTWLKGSAPTQEEIWLAQEDFWVKRELLYLIRQAIDSVALFREQPLPKGEKLEGGVGKRVFRNANWELTLFIEKAPVGRGLVIGDRSRIKNINIDGRTQSLANSAATLGLPFRFQQALGSGSGYKDIRVSGEPLPFEKEAPLFVRTETTSVLSVGAVDLNKPFFIDQLLDWENSPVRRIDKIELAYHSHRTMTGGLKINPVLKALEPVETPEAPAEKETQGNRPPGMQGASAGGPMGAPGGKGGSTAAADVTTTNKMPRDRYLHVTPQARHLPVVLRLIVDQAHIHDILSSIGNSRLRMQITQVSFHHVTDVTRASVDGPAAAGNAPAGNRTGNVPNSSTPPGGKRPSGAQRPPGGPGPSASPPGMMMPSMHNGPSSGGGRMLLGGPRDMDGGTGRTATTSTSKPIDNARLVELSIYAIASLYDRFPPLKKEAATTDTTSAVPAVKK